MGREALLECACNSEGTGAWMDHAFPVTVTVGSPSSPWLALPLPYLDEPGQPKVAHFADIVLSHKNVSGGQVPMDVILGFQVAHALSHLRCNVHQFGNRQLLLLRVCGVTGPGSAGQARTKSLPTLTAPPAPPWLRQRAATWFKIGTVARPALLYLLSRAVCDGLCRQKRCRPETEVCRGTPTALLAYATGPSKGRQQTVTRWPQYPVRQCTAKNTNPRESTHGHDDQANLLCEKCRL